MKKNILKLWKVWVILTPLVLAFAIMKMVREQTIDPIAWAFIFIGAHFAVKIWKIQKIQKKEKNGREREEKDKS